MGRPFVRYQGKPKEKINRNLFFELLGSPELKAQIEDIIFARRKRFYSRGLFFVELKVIFDNCPTRPEMMEAIEPILSHVKKIRIPSDRTAETSIVLRFPTQYYKEFSEEKSKN
jgi:hypothetical protein